MIVSPGIAIVRRELLSGLRNPKPFIFLGVMLIIMIIGLVFMIKESLETALRYNGALSGRDVRGMFMMFSLGLYFGAMLLIPPMAGVSICIEKQQNSYDLLRMTYIRPFSLAIAKLLNVLGIYGLIVVATLPVLGVFFFFVGIDWGQLVLTSFVILTSALSCAAIGLLCSAFFYRTLPAIITTFLLTFFFHGGFLLILAIFSELLFPYTIVGDIIEALIDEDGIFAFAPLASIVLIGENFGRTFQVILGIFYHLALFGGTMVLIFAILNRPARPMRVETERPIDSQEELQARRKKFPYYLLDPRRRRPQIPDGRNPMLAKERQTGLLGRATVGVRVFYGVTLLCFVISLLCIMANSYDVSNQGLFTAMPMFFDTLLLLVLTPALLATSMAKEHEWGNMDILRTTLIDPDAIVVGKFLCSLYTAALPILGAVVGCIPVLLFVWSSPLGWAGFLSGLGNMTICILYTLSITLLVTVSCRRGLTALMLSYGVSIFALIGIPIGLMFCMELSRIRYDENLAAVLMFSSPVSAQFFQFVEGVNEYEGDSFLSLYWFFNLVFCVGASSTMIVLARARFRNFMLHGME